MKAVLSTLGYESTVGAISLFTWPLDEAQAMEWCKRAEKGLANGTEYIFLARKQSSGHPVGCIGLHINAKDKSAEAGYWVDEAFQGRGYASEMLGAVLDYAFNRLDIKQITATTALDNEASAGLLQKHGFRFARYLDVECADGSQRPSRQYLCENPL